VARSQANGFLERFHRTVLDEFFGVRLREKVCAELENIEADLQE